MIKIWHLKTFRALVFLGCILYPNMARGFSRNPQFHKIRKAASTMKLMAGSPDESFDMDELRHRIGQEYAPNLPIGGATNIQMESLEIPDQVYIILFLAGTSEQGAHTIEYPKGSGNNVMLAFESEKACQKFAASLKEQNFLDPMPYQFNMADLCQTCENIGVFIQVVPEGVEIKPPSQNVEKFGHDPSLIKTKKHLEYLLEMTDEDVEETGMLEDVLYQTALQEHPTGAWQ